MSRLPGNVWNGSGEQDEKADEHKSGPAPLHPLGLKRVRETGDNGREARKGVLSKLRVLPAGESFWLGTRVRAFREASRAPAKLDVFAEPTDGDQLAQHCLSSLLPIEPMGEMLPSGDSQITEDSIVLLDAITMFAAPPHEDEAHQQEIFIADRVEDIAYWETLRLPVVRPEEQGFTQTGKRRAVSVTAGGAALAGAGDIAFAALRYLTNVVMTHMVAQGVFGLFVLANTIVTIVGYAAKLGLDSAALRFLALYRARNEGPLAAGLVRFALWIALVGGIFCGGCFYLLSPLLAQLVYHQAAYRLPFQESALLIPLIGLQLVIASALQALKAIKWKVYVDRLIQPVITLLLLAVFFALGLRLEALIFATACGYVGSIILGKILLHKRLQPLVKKRLPRYEAKTWLRFAFPMFFNSMLRNILSSTDILFLGALTTASGVGLYGAAERAAYFALMPLLALNVIFSPIIAEYHARGQQRQLEGMFKVVTKWSFSLSWPLFLCCVLFREPILGIFGAKYTAAALTLVILALGNLVDAGTGSVNYLLVMTGRPRVILINTITTVVINVLLAIMLIPAFSIVGAAIAATLTVIILNFVALIEVYWIMKIHPYRWDIFKPILAGGVASLTSLLLLHFIHIGYGYKAIVGTLALVIPFLLAYVLVLALLRFSEEDLMVFETVRARLTRNKAA